MTVIVKDPLNNYSAQVTAFNRLKVDAQTNLTAHFVSLRDQLAFNLSSLDTGGAANDYIAYLQNTSPTRLLFIDIVRVGAANAVVFKVSSVTGTAAGSSALTPQNLNLTSSVAAEATARGDGAITGLTEDRLLALDRVAAGTSSIIPFDDILVLGENDAIAVEYDSGTGGQAEVVVRFFYLDRDMVLAS